ncbi:MAG: cytochrome C [Pseudooceanicola sp.]|jgi:cytochrome c|nr:cytochrome C [Pseudooceanicola sp.]|tara:strand:- start:2085 stop:2492 length:408 start_codon:yes stop_codon:yes gene_type:complete
MTRIALTLAALCMAAPLHAQDAAKGENGFKKCRACHSIQTDAGDFIVKGGRTGPNLYSLAGRQAGTAEGFNYGDDMVAAGEKGLTWDAETFAAYTADPREFLKEYLDDSGAKSKMAFKLKSGAEDIFAYIESVSN